MKHFLLCILMLGLSGCCTIVETPFLQKETLPDQASELYRFHLERSGTTGLSGLLALKPRENGMWGVLLDATGVPLVKLLVMPDHSYDIKYCATAVCETRLPELLGKLIDYIYFIPANEECPWYALSCICQVTDDSGRSIKWKRFGPLHLWEVEYERPSMESEEITIHMKLSSVTVRLQRMEKEKRY